MGCDYYESGICMLFECKCKYQADQENCDLLKEYLEHTEIEAVSRIFGALRKEDG